jgi:hypothetical protein
VKQKRYELVRIRELGQDANMTASGTGFLITCNFGVHISPFLIREVLEE